MRVLSHVITLHTRDLSGGGERLKEDEEGRDYPPALLKLKDKRIEAVTRRLKL